MCRKDLNQTISPDEQFQNAFGSFFVNFNNLQTFYLTTKELLKAGKDRHEDDFIKKGKEIQKLYIKNALPEHEPLLNFVLHATAKRSVRISSQVIDSAAAVFAHAALDRILSECCQISFAIAPSDWYPFIGEQKIRIKDLKMAENFVWQKADEFISQLDRESLARKLEFLHKICAPHWKGEKLISHWITDADLNEFDTVRHQAVHQKAFAQKISKVEEHLTFARLVGMSVLVLVGKAYGLLEKEKFDLDTILLKTYGHAQSEFQEVKNLVEILLKKKT